jgi:hypothetical protein
VRAAFHTDGVVFVLILVCCCCFLSSTTSELKYRSASTAAASEMICDWSFDLSMHGAVEEGFMRKCLDATANALFEERDKHATTNEELEDRNRQIKTLEGKMSHLSDLYVGETGRLEEEVNSLIGMVGHGKSLATLYGIDLALCRERYDVFVVVALLLLLYVYCSFDIHVYVRVSLSFFSCFKIIKQVRTKSVDH